MSPPENLQNSCDNLTRSATTHQYMATKQIIFVPGKNPKPEAELHRELLWRTLIEGVRRADSAVAAQMRNFDSQFHLVAWNYLYYHTYKDITLDIPWIDALVNKHGPTERDIREAHSWKITLDRLLLTIADHLPLLIRLLPEEARSTANEISRYFDNSGDIASAIRGLLKQMLRPMLDRHEDVLLIGHSLGSVIAYDALWDLTHREGATGKVDLLTLGSPLGMHYIRHRLLGMNGRGKRSYPRTIRRWINMSAEGDVTALNRNLHEPFHDMLRQGCVESIEDHSRGIYNFFRSDAGLNSHRSYGYLVNPAVGRIIADWWKVH